MIHEGKVAIVTGSVQGIGLATAQRLCAEGASVVTNDIQPDLGKQAAESIRNSGGNVVYINGDISDPAIPRAIVDTALNNFDGIDYVVNNAAPPRPPATIDEVDNVGWERQFQVMILGMSMLTQYSVPEMRKRGGGSIVNLSSIHGLAAARDRLIYDTLKHGVIGFTRSTAIALGPDNIRVNALCPGIIIGERMQPILDDNPKLRDLWGSMYPLKRPGRPDEMASVINFLLSDDASYVTGTTIVADGGGMAQLQENVGWDVHDTITNPDGSQTPMLEAIMKKSFDPSADEST